MDGSHLQSRQPTPKGVFAKRKTFTTPNIFDALGLIDALREMMRSNPDYVEGQKVLGCVYGELGDFAKAIECLKKADELAPNDPAILNHLGDAYRRGGRLNDALETLREAVRLDPENAFAHYNLAECYFRTGRTQEALEQFRILRNLDEDMAKKFYEELVEPDERKVELDWMG